MRPGQNPAFLHQNRANGHFAIRHHLTGLIKRDPHKIMIRQHPSISFRLPMSYFSYHIVDFEANAVYDYTQAR
jgi:hypothetical protein